MAYCRFSPAFLLLLLALSLLMPANSSAYFVLTRYSALPHHPPHEEDAAVLRVPPQQNWGANAAASDSLDQLAQELGLAEWMRPMKMEPSTLMMISPSATKKRSAGAAKTLSGHEHVCKTVIRTDFRPSHGHEQNGTRVEIQQDERRQFSATFVECENTKREHCHGIDNAMFSSECVTVYEFRPAGVRVEGSAEDFVEGLVKVPITCQCRLRRKIGNGILPNL